MREIFDLGGEHVHAIPITDRLGWHGSVTTHYVSPSGIYIGSENKDTHTITRVTTAEQLMKIWKNADLTQPGVIERPKSAAASTGRREQPASIDQEPLSRRRFRDRRGRYDNSRLARINLILPFVIPTHPVTFAARYRAFSAGGC